MINVSAVVFIIHVHNYHGHQGCHHSFGTENMYIYVCAESIYMYFSFSGIRLGTQLSLQVTLTPAPFPEKTIQKTTQKPPKV